MLRRIFLTQRPPRSQGKPQKGIENGNAENSRKRWEVAVNARRKTTKKQPKNGSEKPQNGSEIRRFLTTQS
jgi:hypothetical protein